MMTNVIKYAVALTGGYYMGRGIAAEHSPRARKAKAKAKAKALVAEACVTQVLALSGELEVDGELEEWQPTDGAAQRMLMAKCVKQLKKAHKIDSKVVSAKVVEQVENISTWLNEQARKRPVLDLVHVRIGR